MRFFSWICKSREKPRPTRTAVKPRAEQLDERAVPAPLGFGFGGLVPPSFGGFGRLGGPRLSVVGNNTFGFNQGVGRVNRFGAFNPSFNGFNRPFLAFNRPVFNPTSPGDFPFGPGGFFNIVRTPGGFAGLEGNGFGGFSSLNASSSFASNPTSPNDFPFGPGGFFNIVSTPSGFAGLE